MLRQAAESGQLYGSVSPRDLAALVSEKGFALNRAQIALNTPIKSIGLHKVPISLHPEVEVAITVTVARSADEAARLARGEDITLAREEPVEPAEEGAGAFFDAEAMRRGTIATKRPRRRSRKSRPDQAYSSNGSSAGGRAIASVEAPKVPVTSEDGCAPSMLSAGRRGLSTAEAALFCSGRAPPPGDMRRLGVDGKAACTSGRPV